MPNSLIQHRIATANSLNIILATTKNKIKKQRSIKGTCKQYKMFDKKVIIMVIIMSTVIIGSQDMVNSSYGMYNIRKTIVEKIPKSVKKK